MIERFYTPGLAQVAYGVADPPTRQAAIIDPRRDVDSYLAWAAGHGFEIVAILETHVHADFVSGARELAAATGATVYAGRLGETEFPHVPLDDGAIVLIGGRRATRRSTWPISCSLRMATGRQPSFRATSCSPGRSAGRTCSATRSWRG
jgi:glyoxylase-like metal-dependent hydrolase (beta-lactamase superfamily II)